MNVEQDIRSLVEAERELRLNAERIARAYREVMTEAAFRLAGAKLEELRRANPDTPDGWTPADWRDFWLTIHLNGGSGWQAEKGENGNGAKLAVLERENRTLREKLEQVRQELALAQKELEAQRQKAAQAEAKPKEPKEKKGEVQTTPTSRSLAAGDLPAAQQQLLDELKALAIPQPPGMYQQQLGAKENPLRYRRKVMILYLIARGGINSRLEVDRMISVVEGLSPRSNSVKAPAEELVKSGLLMSATLTMSEPFQTSLAVYRLSEDGKAVCRLWGWEVVESEWERVNRLHQGDVQEAHTLMLLSFAMHARMRGWNALLLPEAQGNADPDVLVERDGERWYVEVERGDGSRRKWRNLAQLNNGKAALCAADPAGRDRLVRDCKAERLGGVASDLRSLVFDENNRPRSLVDIGRDDPLWLERW